MKRKRTSSGMTYQVFLSFRGLDTRQGFTDVLYHALADAGIWVFRDDEEIWKGEDIGDEILRAIGESRILVPIFSKGYASSKWCLIELSKMFESKVASESSKKILPIFYDVGVDDVKLKTELYAKALLKHREKFNPDTVQQWEEALRKAGNLKGWELKNSGHGEFAKMFVREISMKLKLKHRYVTEYLVQRDDQVEALMHLLDIEASGVRFVGIHGMGGIGKTTLAKIVFNKLCDRYECCSFLADVRESSGQHKGMEHLQKQLLGNLCPTTRDIMDVDDGIMWMREMLIQKKVLIVLDDVDDREQIQNLVGDASWLSQGSRIIITTRNRQVLGRGIQTLKLVAMKHEEALQLFSMHAFDKDSPPKKHLRLSKEAVASTGRLPLALEVIGSHLRDRPHKDWAETIKRLKKVPHEKVQKKLMISYEALDHGTKQIFLDIACFFIGYEKTFPMYIWDSCGFDAKMGLEVLIHMSLVKTVVEKDVSGWREIKVKRLWMHDQLRDLGREIIRIESSKNNLQCNRLWMHEDAFEVLQEEEGKENVEMLRLRSNYDSRDGCYYYDSTKRYTLTGKEFSGLRKLRYLECHEADFTGDWRHLLPELRWLSWRYCFGEFTSLSLKKLVILDLSHSIISEDWSGWSQIGVGNKLKVLDLSHTELRKTPDFSKYSSLERLTLVDCYRLVEIDPSIGKLKGLKFLNVSGCSSLKGFPKELCSLDHLEVILGTDLYEAFDSSDVDLSEVLFFENDDLFCKWDLEKCPEVKFFSMPESIGKVRSLLTLVLDGAHITELPESIGRLSRLRCLSLCGCWRFERLPDSLADMKSLVELHLSRTSIVELPQRVGRLVVLEILDLRECENMKKLPDSIGDMKSLVELDLSQSGITKLPATIGMLKRLEILHACGCRLLEEIPSTIMGCTSLRVLNLSNCERMKQLPDSVSDLRSLALLCLSCTGISELPYNIGNLMELRVIHLNFSRIQKLPTSIGMLKRLEELHILECGLLTEIPSEIEGCTGLRILDLDGAGVNQLPPKLPALLTDVRIGNKRQKNTRSTLVGTSPRLKPPPPALSSLFN